MKYLESVHSPAKVSVTTTVAADPGESGQPFDYLPVFRNIFSKVRVRGGNNIDVNASFFHSRSKQCKFLFLGIHLNLISG